MYGIRGIRSQALSAGRQHGVCGESSHLVKHSLQKVSTGCHLDDVVKHHKAISSRRISSAAVDLEKNGTKTHKREQRHLATILACSPIKKGQHATLELPTTKTGEPCSSHSLPTQTLGI